MKSPLKIALAWFSRKFQELTGGLSEEIQAQLKKETSPQRAVDKSFKKQGIFGKLRQRVTEVIEKAAGIGLGQPPKPMPELYEAWDAGGMRLSEKLHGADREMRAAIVDTIREQLRLGSKAQKSALALYDGYNTGKHVIRRQELPLYLHNIVSLARRGELTERDKAALQRLIRRAKAQTERLGANGAPNQALKAAYNELLAAVSKDSAKALERGIRLAVEEKSRYVAERIARTEAARAWADAFHARYKDDEEVLAYKWQLSSRHPAFDICDMYAEANLHGLGKGIFPKDKCPVLPVHPHCLCHLSPVFKGETDPSRQKDRVKKGGDEWLGELSHHERCRVLGVEGAKAWENGQGDWRENMRGYSADVMGTRLTDAAAHGKMQNMNDKYLLFGGVNGALNPDSPEANEHAQRYYGLVRSMKTDCKRIARNTGFREEDIRRIKNHVFYQEHELYDGEIARFEPSYHMAQSWQRLIDGRSIEHKDIVLLNHEFIESVFMGEGFRQDKAHREAEKIYNYSILLER